MICYFKWKKIFNKNDLTWLYFQFSNIRVACTCWGIACTRFQYYSIVFVWFFYNYRTNDLENLCLLLHCCISNATKQACFTKSFLHTMQYLHIVHAFQEYYGIKWIFIPYGLFNMDLTKWTKLYLMAEGK